MFVSQPEPVPARPWSVLPDRFRKPRRTPWADVNAAGAELDSFLEGPAFDRDGNLYVVDVPFGRLFRITPDGSEWTLAYEWDAWPNGAAIHRDGRVFIADYKRGIFTYTPSTGKLEPVAETYRSESFKGCNDVTFSRAGDLYFTDQGQTGWHDPSGRIMLLGANGTPEAIAGGIPSPNGLVLNRDERQLWVAVTRANAVWRFPLLLDGSVSKVGTFIQMSGGSAGPDGLALDDEGGVTVTHLGTTCWRFDRLGQLTHVLDAGGERYFTNAAYGGAGNRTLYATEAQTGTVYASTLPFAGRALFSHL
jgi:gluconolactonase